ncbi:MAG TPA: hypothetical protein VJX28_03890 [Chthoniobacterales bacterium]|nr:hypothetical protein [Chthoniobacterales bacterium]
MALPKTQILQWSDLEARYAELQARPLTGGNAYSFLVEWSDLSKTAAETGA